MRLWQTNQLHRINLLEGSVSSGKTWVSLVLWAFWVKVMPLDGLYLMCAKSLTTLKRNCLILLQELVGESNFRYSVTAKEGTLFGRKVILEGANDIRSESKIRGVTLQGAYCDELTQFPEDFFAMLLSRLRLPGAKLIATTNPDSPSHWLKTKYIDRADSLDFLDVQFLIDDNTTLPKDYVENIKREYIGVFYDRFILGRWTMAEGIIYPEHDRIISEAPEGLAEKYVLSIDYGTQNPFSAGLWGKYKDKWWRVREYYYGGREMRVQKTDAEYLDALHKTFGDIIKVKGRLTVIIDPSAASFIALLRQDRSFTVRKADNAVLDGIRETATAMHKGLIQVAPSCTDWIREAGSYVWDDSAADDRPIKENDHAMDETRYFVKTMRILKPKNEYVALHERQGW